MLVHVAVKHPHSHVVRNHIRCDELCGEQRENVSPMPPNRNHVSMPVRRMDIDLPAHGHHIPPHVLSALHHQHWQIAKHITVNAGPEIRSCKADPSTVKVSINVAESEVTSVDRIW